MYNRKEKIEDWLSNFPANTLTDYPDDYTSIKRKQKPKSTNQFCSSNYRGVQVIFLSILPNRYNRGKKWNSQIQVRGKKLVIDFA